jgi:DNA-binding NarL/FixJ family response regulator
MMCCLSEVPNSRVAVLPWPDVHRRFDFNSITWIGGRSIEVKRELILSRISEGRKRARQNGIKFGRKPKLTSYQRQEALERLAQGESQSTIARSFNVDRATISRLARR